MSVRGTYSGKVRRPEEFGNSKSEALVNFHLGSFSPDCISNSYFMVTSPHVGRRVDAALL